MANVIEILINAKNNATAEFEKSAGSLAKFTTAAGLAGAAGALAGNVIVTAMQNASQAIIGNTLKMADNVEMLDRMANYTGLSVQQLQVFRREIERGGLSSDQLSQALRYLREQLNSGDQKLSAFGITSRDTFTALQQMAGAMQRAKDVGDRAAISTATLGMRNAELAESITAVAGAYSSKLNDAQRNNAVMSGDQLTSFRNLDKAMDDLRDSANAFKAASAQMFAPLIEGSAKLITNISRVSGELRDIEERQARQMRARGQSWATAGTGLPMASSHGTSDYDQWVAFFAGGSGGGGGGGGSAPAGRATVWARPWDQGASGMGIMATLPTLVVSMAEILKRMTGAAGGGIGDGSSKTTDALTKPLDSVHQAALRFGANIEGAFRTAFSNVLNITTTSTNAVVQLFTALANGILQTISDMLAEAAARGLVDFALSFVSGGTSAAAKVGSVFKSQPLSAGRSTGNTFVIQAIDARSAMDDILNPTGSLRRANDRVRDIAIAQAG